MATRYVCVMHVRFTCTGEEELADVALYPQKPAQSSTCRVWQQPNEAAAVANLLRTAAFLLDAHTDTRAGRRGAQAAGPAAAAEEHIPPAIICHIERHLHLVSRFLLAPWHLQDQVGSCCPAPSSDQHSLLMLVNGIHLPTVGSYLMWRHFLCLNRCTGGSQRCHTG